MARRLASDGPCAALRRSTLDSQKKNFDGQQDATSDDLFKLHRQQLTGRSSAPHLTAACLGPTVPITIQKFRQLGAFTS